MPYVKPKIAKETLGVTEQTLRLWGKEGRIKYITGGSGHRLYDIDSFISKESKEAKPKEEIPRKKYIYCRVSSNKQKEDLERQTEYLSAQYPNHEVLKEIASGINFKRRVLTRLLNEVSRGEVGEIVVAHRDRLCRIAWELFSWLFKRYDVNIVVDGEDEHPTPETEMANDLLSIIHVFSCRHYGQRRKYTKRKLRDGNVEDEEQTGENEEIEG